jgi:phage-related protein
LHGEVRDAASKADAIAVLEVFRKTTRVTPEPVMDTSKKRIRRYGELSELNLQ